MFVSKIYYLEAANSLAVKKLKDCTRDMQDMINKFNYGCHFFSKSFIDVLRSMFHLLDYEATPE